MKEKTINRSDKIKNALDVLDAELQLEQLECIYDATDATDEHEEFRYALYDLINKRRERLCSYIF